MRAVLIGFRLGIDAGWADRTDRVCNIVGAKTASEDHRQIDRLYDLATDAPIMDNAEGTDLHVRRAMTVE